MARGKYSPTIQHIYTVDKDWFKNWSDNGLYDKDGYDDYGYNENKKDRAGCEQYEYLCDEILFEQMIDRYRNFDPRKKESNPVVKNPFYVHCDPPGNLRDTTLGHMERAWDKALQVAMQTLQGVGNETVEATIQEKLKELLSTNQRGDK